MDWLSNKVWSFLTKHYPQFAIYREVRSCKIELDDFSVNSYLQEKEFWEVILQDLSSISYSDLSEQEIITYHIIEYYAEKFLNGFQYEGYLMPVSVNENPAFYFLKFTLTRLEFRTEKDYVTYIQLLGKLPNQLNQVVQLLKLGIEKKIVRHERSLGPKMWGRLSELLNGEVKCSKFYEPFLSTESSISREKWKDLQQRGQSTIEKQVIPSLESFVLFLRQEYAGQLRSELSVDTLPQLPGMPSRYQAALRFFCEVDYSAQEIHQIGLTEMKRLQQRINQVMTSLHFEGSRRDFVDFLHQAKEYQFKDEDEVMTYCEDYYNQILLPKIKALFKPFTQLDLKFERDLGRTPAKAIYSAPTATQPAVLWIAVKNLRGVRKYDIPTLMLHETEPGHHLQACYALGNKSLPKFRTNKDDRNYGIAPSRIPLNAAYTEGWGLYCETLGEELGLYQDLHSLFGYLSSDLDRCARVVVETGIHALRWSREEAVSFMLDNTTMSADTVEVEVDRYITWPGQPVSYKIGQLQFLRLRKFAQEKLGSLFNLVDFHHACLWGGQVPLKILEQMVKTYVEKTLSK